MKRITSVVAAALAGMALLLSAGCQTVSSSSTQYVGVPKFPPTNPAQVQILRTEPTRPSIKLGEIRVEPSSDKVDVTKIENALRTEAAKLGADAAVVVYDKTQVVGAQVVGGWLNRSIETIQGQVVIAVAIKYK
jgi:hypothetical protein